MYLKMPVHCLCVVYLAFAPQLRDLFTECTEARARFAERLCRECSPCSAAALRNWVVRVQVVVHSPKSWIV